MATWKIRIDADTVPYTLDVLGPGSADAVLTTERSESSQGLPVVVHLGSAYGPADLGSHVVYTDDATAATAAAAAGYTVQLLGAGWEEPTDDACTEVAPGLLTY